MWNETGAQADTEPTEGRYILFGDLEITLPLYLVLEDWPWKKDAGLGERSEKRLQPSAESWGESRQEKRGVQDICKHAVVLMGNDKGDLSPGKVFPPWRWLSTGIG